jgi:5-methylcytosine-specific restriction endonuclease McrA
MKYNLETRNSPTLDRINNENIVNLDNAYICCCECNRTKSNRTLNGFSEYMKNVLAKIQPILEKGIYGKTK